MKQDPAIRDIIGDMEHLAAEMVAGKISVLRGTHIEVQLTNLLLKAARTVRDQQYQIIDLEQANDSLARQCLELISSTRTDEELAKELIEARMKIDKLQKRNDNQAALLDAIDQGRAKKVPGGGWTHDNIPHQEVTSP